MGTNTNQRKTNEIQWKPMKSKGKPMKYNENQAKTNEIHWKPMETS